MEEENEGSLLLGIALGFVLGCVGILVAFVLRGSKTLTGSVIGLLLQVVASVCGFSCLFGLQMFLNS